jgi:hypothetical protein
MVHLPPQNMSPLAALAAVLRGEPAAVSADLVDLAEAHRVATLLARAPAAASAPPDIVSRLSALTAGHRAVSAAQDRELTRVLEHLASGGISPILIKGAHLAHTIYPPTVTRPRLDTDLLISVDERERLVSLLESAGYRRAVHVRGNLILGQWHVSRIDDLGVEHALDLHWRLAAPLVFRHVLPVSTVRLSRVHVPQLGAQAWGPSAPHALIIACVHLVAHHRRDPLLLWLQEIARLAETLDDAGMAAFDETVDAARVSAVCASALDRARHFFDGPALASLAERARARVGTRTEPSARLLTIARPIDDMWLDLRTAAGWQERMTLLGEHLWPDAGYMRATSAPGSWLPLAYARRAAFGIRKLFTA